jgi:hypothetical protein
MKPFNHLRILGGIKAKRRALRHYAMYRSNAMGGKRDIDALTEFHLYESLGKFPSSINSFTDFSKSNAYANGKWVMKLTVDMIISDLKDGLFCKEEFYDKGKYTWFYKKALKNILLEKPFFYFEDYQPITKEK